MFRIFFFSLLIFSHSLISAQNIQFFELGDTYFQSTTKFETNFTIQNNSGDRLLFGYFQATDYAAVPHAPFFIHKLGSNDIHFYEDSSGVLIYGFRASAACCDEKNNIYITGAVNGNKILTKLDKDFNVIWCKSQGHHSFSDVKYNNGEIVTTGQDEDSLGNHTIMISVFDTLGNLLKSNSFISNEGFDDSHKVVFTRQGYLLAGYSTISAENRKGLFFIDIRQDLALNWSKILSKQNYTFSINELRINPTNYNINITGEYQNQNNIDTTFYLSLNEAGDLFTAINLIENTNQLHLANTSYGDSSMHLLFNEGINNAFYPLILEFNVTDSIQKALRLPAPSAKVYRPSLDFFVDTNEFNVIGNLTTDSNGSFIKTTFYQTYNAFNIDTNCIDSTPVYLNNFSLEENTSINIANLVSPTKNFGITHFTELLVKTDSSFCKKPGGGVINQLSNKDEQLNFFVTTSGKGKVELIYDSNKYQDLSIIIYSANGAITQQSHYSPHQMIAEMSNAGIYFIQLFDNENYIKTIKAAITY